MTLRRRIAASPLAPVAAVPLRLKAVLHELAVVSRAGWRWLRRSRETTNFNYDIDPLNREHLAWWVADVTGADVARVREVFAELDADEALRAHVRSRTAASPYRRVSDPEPSYGRRLAWYALVRLLQPRLGVETGTDKGLGTCVVAAGVLRNGTGRVVTIDVVEDAGWLVTDAYASVTTRMTGPAADVLRGLADEVDLFVHDVHHTADEERDEYVAIAPRLTDRAVVVNDNAHSFDVLPRWCEETGRRYVHFQEMPAERWYPGSGMGAAVRR